MLVLAGVLLLQLSFLVAQVAEALADVHAQFSRAMTKADRTLAIVRETTEQQRGSYEEIARYSAQSLANLSRLIERTDSRLETLLPAAEELLREASDSTEVLSAQVTAVGSEAEELLREGRATLAGVEQAANRPEFRESAARLARSTENLERMSAAAAESSERVRDMLSPTKKSFWRRLLELMIPRPTIRVGK